MSPKHLPPTLLLLAVLVACSGVSNPDFDDDGSLDQDDCAPENADIYPNAVDPFGNGVDENCDGVDGTDADGDGYPADDGIDCNDLSASVNPGAVEDCDNGGDEERHRRPADPLRTRERRPGRVDALGQHRRPPPCALAVLPRGSRAAHRPRPAEQVVSQVLSTICSGEPEWTRTSSEAVDERGRPYPNPGAGLRIARVPFRSCTKREEKSPLRYSLASVRASL